MIKIVAQISDVFFHSEAAGDLGVVPLEVDPRVQVAFIVVCYVVVLFDGIEQVIDVALAYVLDAKIVNYNGEHNWSPLVAPQARGYGALVVVVLARALFHERVG